MKKLLDGAWMVVGGGQGGVRRAGSRPRRMSGVQRDDLTKRSSQRSSSAVSAQARKQNGE